MTCYRTYKLQSSCCIAEKLGVHQGKKEKTNNDLEVIHPCFLFFLLLCETRAKILSPSSIIFNTTLCFQLKCHYNIEIDSCFMKDKILFGDLGTRCVSSNNYSANVLSRDPQISYMRCT